VAIFSTAVADTGSLTSPAVENPSGQRQSIAVFFAIAATAVKRAKG